MKHAPLKSATRWRRTKLAISIGCLVLFAPTALYYIILGPTPLTFFADVLDAVTMGFLEAAPQSPVSRAKTGMRTIATGLEAYYVDNNVYPALHPLRDYTSDKAKLDAMGGGKLLAIEMGKGPQLPGITTPTAYLSNVPRDPWFCYWKPRFYFRGDYFTHWPETGDLPFAYWHDPENIGWILFSPGPDGDYDIDPEKAYDPHISQPSITLITQYTYDPTNGADSDGDIWRVKE